MSQLRPEPAWPGSSTQTRRLFDRLHCLPRRPGRRILAGHFAGYEGGSVADNQVSLREVEALHQRCGRRVALLGVDYADLRPQAPLGYGYHQANAIALAQHRDGGVVTVSAHLPAPAGAGRLREAGVDVAAVLRPGSPERQRWRIILDSVAAGLKELRDAGVPVLWRPLHEMTGGWFWWGGGDGPAFKDLWRDCFNYFHHQHGLDNLLWHYSVAQVGDPLAYYPGDDYVDFVGLDAYGGRLAQHVQRYARLRSTGKPFAMTEFGLVASDQGEASGGDASQLIHEIAAHTPQAIFFKTWSRGFGPYRHQHAEELYAHPLVLDLAGWRQLCQED